MRHGPKISIVIPVYNGGDYFELALQSALAQTYANTEVVVVNDGSTDNGETDAIARRYAGRIKYIAQPNKGVAGALNTAIANLTGDVFTWLSHDDGYLPEKTSSQVEFFQRLDRDDAIIFSDFFLMDDKGEVWHEAKLDHQRFVKTPMIPLLTGGINGCTLFIPVPILRQFGPFDETLRYTQDYELWNKILHRHEFFHHPKTVIKYRIHPGQDTNKPGAAIEGDGLWVRMLESRSETERVQLFGSTKKFFVSMADFLDKTPYNQAAAFAHSRIEPVVADTLVSVVIPFFNAIDNVLEAADSALRQSHQKIEVILVDDGSTEDIGPVAALDQGDSRVRLLRQGHAGPGAARNRGMAAAAGQYIAFLDPGDRFLPHKTSTQLEEMQNRGIVFSYGCAVSSAEQGEASGAPSEFPPQTPYPEIMLSQEIVTSTVMLHRSLPAQGFAFPPADAAEGAAWAWVAARHGLLGMADPFTLLGSPGAKDAEIELTRLKARRALHTDLSSDPVHSRDPEALEQLATALASEQEALEDRRRSLALGLLDDADRMLERGSAPEAIAAARRSLDLSETREGLLRTAGVLQVAGRYDEALALLVQRFVPRYGLDGELAPLAVAHALVGAVPEAITLFRRHLADAPGDSAPLYHLASCLAWVGAFEEADALFRKNIEIPLYDHRRTSTAIIRLNPEVSAESSTGLRRGPIRLGSPPASMDEAEIISFLSCDSNYLKKFGRSAVLSVGRNAGLRIGIHIHLLNPDLEALALIEALRTECAAPIVVSQEMVGIDEFPGDALRTYFSVARFLILPELLRRYDKPMLVTDVDQIVVRSLAGFLDSIAEKDVALLRFPHQAFNLLSLFSASVLVVRPSDGGRAFAERVRDCILDRIIALDGEISWHLDQAALAVAQLTSPALRWHAIPPEVLQSDLSEEASGGVLSRGALFWSVTASVGKNTGQRVGAENSGGPRAKPRILFVCFPYSIHAARWVSLFSEAGWDCHVFPSQVSNAVHEGFTDVTFWPVPGLPLPEHARRLSLGAIPADADSIAAPGGLARNLRAVLQQTGFDLVQTLEFQHAGYLMLDAVEDFQGLRPRWVATNYGADIVLFGKQPEHESRIRQLLARCDYYSSECQRDVELARALGYQGPVMPVMPNSGGFDLTELAPLRQPGPTSARKVIAIKGYQHFAGRALTALQALDLCKESFEGYHLIVFAPFPEVRATAERLEREGRFRITCLPDSVPHEDILRLHGSARISIAISIADGISTSLLEAMAMGSFPIQTSTACACEWIEDGRGGFIVEPDDPQSIADRIDAALRDDALVDRAAEINFERILTKGNKAVIRKRIRQAYLDLVPS